MNVKLITVGKTVASYLIEGEAEYQNRLKHYMRFERIDINDLKGTHKLSHDAVKKKEAELILNKIKASDSVVLLDENGQDMSSINFSKWFDKKGISGIRDLVFIIGGAYGFDNSIYKLANDKIRLSSMTYSHQMVRLFFLEQLYRAGTLIKGEKYHHQ
jgi:23S rRNA (pseudouridine1915-N3)-methyltransferase